MTLQKKMKMRIKFTGYWNIPPEDVPDERGTVDVGLVGHIHEILERGPEIEDIFSNLELSWDVEV